MDQALTSFVGREQDLASLQASVERARLVTILGPPGAGKTRLAAEYAKRHALTFPGGIWFCELIAADSREALVMTVARTLDVALAEMDDPARALGRALGERGAALVILDNFEHLAQHAETTVGAWLRDATHTRFLVTSRQRLGLGAEVAFDLQPLPLPREGASACESEAVQLFVDRARAVRRDFELTGDNERIVADLVRELDGLPLAIELCAARVRLLSPKQLLERMAQRFELLRATNKSARGLWEAIESSWQLLSPAEAETLAACSVFRGSFDLEAAEAVVSQGAWAIDVLHALVDSSLLSIYRMGDVLPAENRYTLYVAIREYAATMLERSDRAAEVERRHAEYFVRCGAVWAERIKRQGSAVALAHLARERDDILAAYRWAKTNDEMTLAFEAAVALAPLLIAKGPLGLAMELFDALPTATPELRARELEATVPILYFVRGTEARRAACAEGLALALELGDRQLEAMMRFHLGLVHNAEGDSDAAHAEFESALALYRSIGDRRGEGMAHGGVGNAWYARNRYDEAAQHYQSALEAQRDSGDRLLEGTAMFQLGACALETGRLGEARQQLEAAFELLEEAGDRRWVAYAIGYLAIIDQEEGRLAKAQAGFEHAVQVSRGLGARRAEGCFLGYLANCLLEAQRPQEALVVYDEALRVMEEIGESSMPIFLGCSAVAHAMVGDVALARTAFEAATTAAKEAYMTRALCFLGGVLDVVCANERDAALVLAPDPEQSDVRFAKRLLVRALGQNSDVVVEGRMASTMPPPPALPSDVFVIEKSGLWFRTPGCERVKLHRRRALRRIIAALVKRRDERPGSALPLGRLVEAGWPGEVIQRDAAADRAYSAVATLRRMGLRSLLLSVEDGYALDPDVSLCLVDDAD